LAGSTCIPHTGSFMSLSLSLRERSCHLARFATAHDESFAMCDRRHVAYLMAVTASAVVHTALAMNPSLTTAGA